MRCAAIRREQVVGFLYDPRCLDCHSLPAEEADVPERMHQATNAFDLLVSKHPASFRRLPPDECQGPLHLGRSDEQLLSLVHSSEYLKALENEIGKIPEGDPVSVTKEPYLKKAWMTSDSMQAIHASVHVLCKATDLLFLGTMSSAFCAVRPPGHHAGINGVPHGDPDNGFCLANNVVVAAKYAQEAHGVQRVAIIDIDAHHGNGIEEASEEGSGILYMSVHACGMDEAQSAIHNDDCPIYPGTGKDSPHPFVANFPIWPKVTPEAMLDLAFPEIIRRLQAYRPELIIVAAGFDAHKEDPMQLGTLADKHYHTIASRVCEEARQWGGCVLTALEGGYCYPTKNKNQLQHLGRGIAAFCLGLAGQPMPKQLRALPRVVRGSSSSSYSNAYDSSITFFLKKVNE